MHGEIACLQYSGPPRKNAIPPKALRINSA